MYLLSSDRAWWPSDRDEPRLAHEDVIQISYVPSVCCFTNWVQGVCVCMCVCACVGREGGLLLVYDKDEGVAEFMPGQVMCIGHVQATNQSSSSAASVLVTVAVGFTIWLWDDFVFDRIFIILWAKWQNNEDDRWLIPLSHETVIKVRVIRVL